MIKGLCDFVRGSALTLFPTVSGLMLTDLLEVEVYRFYFVTDIPRELDLKDMWLGEWKPPNVRHHSIKFDGCRPSGVEI